MLSGYPTHVRYQVMCWYQSENSDVITDLKVDEYGLVRRYAGGWECATTI